MKQSRSALLYTLLAMGAIAGAGLWALSGDPGGASGAADAPAAAPASAAAMVDPGELAALRTGDMKKLAFHETPKPVPDTPFTSEDGGETSLEAWRGKWVLLNFWATWCAPCREEMPHLAALQEEFAGPAFEVVTLATGRNPPPAMKKFFDEIGVDNLPLHTDPRQQVARDMAVLGLPITVLIDPEGREVARLRGGADWNSDSARAIVSAIATTGG